MNSYQGRLERYKIFYIYKSMIPSLGLVWNQSERNGRKIVIPKVSGKVQSIVTLKEKCINIAGAKLFNMLPKILRNFQGNFKMFKNMFDKWMVDVPDCPNMPGYISHNLDDKGHMSNSLTDWCRNLKCDDWTPEKEILK